MDTREFIRSRWLPVPYLSIWQTRLLHMANPLPTTSPMEDPFREPKAARSVSTNAICHNIALYKWPHEKLTQRYTIYAALLNAGFQPPKWMMVNMPQNRTIQMAKTRMPVPYLSIYSDSRKYLLLLSTAPAFLPRTCQDLPRP